MMQRLAVLSDIHGNIAALEAVMADAEVQGITDFVNLGDIVSGPLWPAETADFLMRYDWPTIAGNHERQLLTQARDVMGASDAYAAATLGDAHRRWLAALPTSCTYSAAIFLCHGTPSSDLAYCLETVEPDSVRAASAAEVIARTGAVRHALTLCGHTHVPRAIRLSDGRQVANPGSVGLQAYDWDVPYYHAIENGDPKARYAIVEPDLRITFRAIDYDHHAAAAKARKEGRDDWAIALEQGVVG